MQTLFGEEEEEEETDVESDGETAEDIFELFQFSQPLSMQRKKTLPNSRVIKAIWIHCKLLLLATKWPTLNK